MVVNAMAARCRSLPHLLLVLAVAIAITPSILPVAAARKLKPGNPQPRLPTIVDPSVCLDSVADCSPTAYCKNNGTSALARCAPLERPGARCRQTADCVAGTFCNPKAEPTCDRQSRAGGACNPTLGNICPAGLVCAPPKSNACQPAPACDGPIGRCLAPVRGRAGAPCARGDGDCAQTAGFYCRSGSPARCAAKLPTGSRCGLRPDNFECRGFCTRGALNGGRCAPSQAAGGLCTDNLHCGFDFDTTRRSADRLFCNQPRGRDTLGVCARPSQLLRQLGAACTPARDLCDSRRGLSCRWAPHLRRAVCQQRYDPLATRSFRPFCTVGSRLSSCPGPQMPFPSECRLARVVPGVFSRSGRPPEAFSFCLPRRRFVPLGSRCDLEHVTCTGGASCRIVRGLLLEDLGRFARSAPNEGVYCVRTLPRGAKCDNARKFVALCADGDECVGGKCVAAKPVPRGSLPPPVPNTHADLRGSCARLPCAPGLVCTGQKLCERPVVTTGFGHLCDDAGLLAPKCKPGLVCRTKWSGHGFRRCRFPQGVGAFCRNDRWCKKGLRCPRVVTNGRAAQESRCFDPKMSLWLGQKCNPRAQRFGRRCATLQVSDGFGSPVLQALRCLPKPNRVFRCQVDVGPFGMCDGKKNRACGDWRFECRSGLCLPRK